MSKKLSYVPPFTITDEITTLVAEISEMIGELSVTTENLPSPKLRKQNRIKTIQSSLAIENNTLSVDQVTDILDGKRVLGAPNEIKEVKNAIDAYYAGDYLTMVENNEDLRFFYPEEGTNIFIDSACILKNAQNSEAALEYLNFLLEPDIATANAEYIGYASPNTAVINNPDYYYYQNEILYPAENDKPKVQYYHDIDDSIRSYYENLWVDVKLY